MPRANRHFLPGYVWHITHRCHRKAFLLKFARDRRRYLHWLFEAKKRFGLCVLNYAVTSNHIHLLIKDTGGDVIPRSMQLIAGRTAQEFNQRKDRQGAFWEDRYHATAIDVDKHLHRCLVYIDLNMVRAGVVRHPCDWTHGGYCEIQKPHARYGIVDIRELTRLCGFADIGQLQQAHREWVTEGLKQTLARHDRWSEALAVGSSGFVARVKKELGMRASGREVTEMDGTFTLREPEESYSDVFARQNDTLSRDNRHFWDESLGRTGT
jgi:REP element-mobilizing transposase RayT